MKKLFPAIILAFLAVVFSSCDTNADIDIYSSDGLVTVRNTSDTTMKISLASLDWNLPTGNEIYRARKQLTKPVDVLPGASVTIPFIVSKVDENRSMAVLANPKGLDSTWWKYLGTQAAFQLNTYVDVIYDGDSLSFEIEKLENLDFDSYTNDSTPDGTFDVTNATDEDLWIEYVGFNYNQETYRLIWNSVKPLSKRTLVKPGEKVTFKYRYNDFTNKKNKISMAGFTYYSPNYNGSGNRYDTWAWTWEYTSTFPESFTITVDSNDSYKVFKDEPAVINPLCTLTYYSDMKYGSASYTVEDDWESIEINFDDDYSDVLQFTVTTDIIESASASGITYKSAIIPLSQKNKIVFADIISNEKYGLKDAKKITSLKIQNITETTQTVEIMKSKVTKKNGYSLFQKPVAEGGVYIY